MQIYSLPESDQHKGEYLNVGLECSDEEKQIIIRRGWLYRPLLPLHMHKNFTYITVKDIIDNVLKIEIPSGYVIHEIDYCLRRECAQIQDDIYYEKELERKKLEDLSLEDCGSDKRGVRYG